MQIRPGVEVADAALEALCRRYHVNELLLFGSSARGEAREDSDVDLLVAYEPDAVVTFFTMARLQRELSAALGQHVDLVPKEGLKTVIRDHVLAEARRLYLAA